ncbi:MAG TPA: CARDB domain-containing protein [Candidatus Binatia bacterium]|nr:CARDB domain-containing protein [Candidatus Binatia bacterium]
MAHGTRRRSGGRCAAGGRAVLGGLIALLALPTAGAAHHAPFAGFGAITRGGAGQPIYRVTTLEDSGPGSLRDAVSQGNRYVVFDVGGTIHLRDVLCISGVSNLTIDGRTAPAPGITVSGWTTAIGRTRCSAGATDIILTNLRFRRVAQPAHGQCLLIGAGARRVVIDHVSTSECLDDALDSYGDSSAAIQDVTVQWSIMANGIEGHNLATTVQRNNTRNSFHHNLFINVSGRSPRVSNENRVPADVMVDFRNNVVWNWTSRGVTLNEAATVNVVNNVFWTGSPEPAVLERGLIVCRRDGAVPPSHDDSCSSTEKAVDVYTAGNVSLNHTGMTDFYNARGNRAVPWPAPAVGASDACTGAHAVKWAAGAQPRDAVDEELIASVDLAGCGPGADPVPEPPAGGAPSSPDLTVRSLSAPSVVGAGQTIDVGLSVANVGTGGAAASTARLYLAGTGTPGTGDSVLASVPVPALAAGATFSTTVRVSVPSSTASGSRYLVLRADDGQVAAEVSEANNALAMPVTVSALTVRPDLAVISAGRPDTVRRGVAFAVAFTVQNLGQGPAAASQFRLYLSRDGILSPDDLILREVATPALAPGAKHSTYQLQTVIPTSQPSGAYYLLFVTDAAGSIAESNETNNVRPRPIAAR